MELMNNKNLYYDLITKQLFEDTENVTALNDVGQHSNNADSYTSGVEENGSTEVRRKKRRNIPSHSPRAKSTVSTYSSAYSQDETDSEAAAAKIRNRRTSEILKSRKNTEVDRLKEELKVPKIFQSKKIK